LIFFSSKYNRDPDYQRVEKIKPKCWNAKISLKEKEKIINGDRR